MIDFMKEANELNEDLLKDRRYLHQNPEIGMNLPKTTKYIRERLAEVGIEAEEIIPNGLVAVIGKKEGKTILLRSDMDALPMHEENDLPFRSKENKAHMCGHDMHMTMLLGAARLLKKYEDKLNGQVKLMFQPGEETFEGALAMIEAGLLESPKPDVGFGIHMSLEDEVNNFYYSKNHILASCDGFEITIKGKSCHGAMPNFGVDPINVGVHIYLAFQELLAREVPALETAILTLGQFTSGSSTNIIPDSATLKGTLRTHNPQVRENLLGRMKDIIESVAKTYRAEAEYKVLSDVPAAYVDPSFLDEIIGYAKDINHDFKFTEAPRLTASDDYAYITELLPSAYVQLCAKTPGNPFPLHNPKAVLDEKVLPLGAAVHAHTAFYWLKNN